MNYNNRRLALNIFWIILGAVLLALSVAEVLDSIFAGMGGALMAVGALWLARSIRYRKDAAYREKIDIEVNDERGRFLRMKSWPLAGYIVVLAEAAGPLTSPLPRCLPSRAAFPRRN